jgi:hypothetical protein
MTRSLAGWCQIFLALANFPVTIFNSERVQRTYRPRAASHKSPLTSH